MIQLHRTALNIKLILLWLILLSLPVSSQDSRSDSIDHNHIIGANDGQYRNILPDSLLNSYLNDEEFMSMFKELAEVGFWDKIGNWLWKHIFRHIFSESLTSFYKIVFYIIIFSVFVYFVSRFFKVSPRSLFYGSKNSGNQRRSPIIYNSDFKTDLDNKLNLAIQNKDYREALRILFVQTLQKLNLKKRLVLSRGKTNLEYFRELNDPEIKAGFQKLALIFDYVWYGEFPLSKERFANFQVFFKEYHKQLGGK